MAFRPATTKITAALVFGDDFSNHILRTGESLDPGHLGEGGGAADRVGQQKFNALGSAGGMIM